MKKIIITIMIAVSGLKLGAQEQQTLQYTNLKFLNTITATEAISYRYSVYMLPNQTYAYVIFANDQQYLHQANMPGKPPATGFSSEEKAKKVAELVIKRLELPVIPAKVSTLEMQYLGVN